MVGKGAVDELFDVVGRARVDDPSADSGGAVPAINPGDDDKEQVEIILRVHVQPGAGRTEVIGRHGDALKVRVAAPPEGGRANEAVAGLVATTLGVPNGAVSLVSGASSRSKRFRVGPIELGTVRRLLAGAAPPSKPGGGSRSGNVGGGRGVR